MSVDHLAESAEQAGLRAEVLLPPASVDVGGDMDVIRMHWRDRALTLHAPGLNLLLYELVQPKTWTNGLREVLTLPDAPAEPVLVFADEADAWCQ